jgi:hypothetical protein
MGCSNRKRGNSFYDTQNAHPSPVPVRASGNWDCRNRAAVRNRSASGLQLWSMAEPLPSPRLWETKSFTRSAISCCMTWGPAMVLSRVPDGYREQIAHEPALGTAYEVPLHARPQVSKTRECNPASRRGSPGGYRALSNVDAQRAAATAYLLQLPNSCRSVSGEAQNISMPYRILIPENAARRPVTLGFHGPQASQ